MAEQLETTTLTIILPQGEQTVVTTQEGLMGAKGDQGAQGIPGEDGEAQIPEVMDGGNF